MRAGCLCSGALRNLLTAACSSKRLMGVRSCSCISGRSLFYLVYVTTRFRNVVRFYPGASTRPKAVLLQNQARQGTVIRLLFPAALRKYYAYHEKMHIPPRWLLRLVVSAFIQALMVYFFLQVALFCPAQTRPNIFHGRRLRDKLQKLCWPQAVIPLHGFIALLSLINFIET